MKRDFDAILKTLDGEPFKADDKDLMLKTICLNAIGAPIQGDETMSGEKKFGLYKLADRINKGGVLEVTAEEVASIKDRIAKAYAIMVIGAAFRLLEQDVA